MRRRFRDRSIREKLTAITLASSASALLFAATGFFIWDVVEYRLQIARDLVVLARTLGENSSAPLAFADERAAGETLAVLELHPNIAAACIYDAAGRPFATYFRNGAGSCPGTPADFLDVGWTAARLAGPVMLERNRIGTLLLERDMSDLRRRIAIGGATVAGLLVVATLMALLIGARLQRAITRPLLQLADTARRVSGSSDYSLRAQVASNDEVGVVVRSFNDMLNRIEERTRELVDANRLKDEFLATLSHELRTPLNAVVGWVRVLRSTNLPPATHAKALESIERNARLQAALIEDLLEVSRIVTGKLRLDVRPCDLAAIIDAAVEVVQPAATAKGIRIATELARPAPAEGDPDRLQQVVWNLLSNAVKFTPHGGHVTARLVHAGDGYVITVADNGIGIEPSFLPHMFQRFRQGDASPTREAGGLGLGLAIVRQLVELHGGTVSVESEGRGKGATFHVHLPAAPARVVLQPTAPPKASRPLLPPDDFLQGMQVLVVEDEDDARELLKTILESRGAHVSAARSAAEALAALDRAVPDVIVSDIGMPVEDGYSLMKRIRQRPATAGGSVPAVALTAYAAERDRQQALAAGYQAHMPKPFEPNDLVAVVGGMRGGGTGKRLDAGALPGR